MKRLIYILIVIALMGCSKIRPTHYEQAPLRVNVSVVSPTEFTSSTRYVGVVEAAQEIPLSLQTTGRVVSLGAKNGVYLRKGQMILCVDSTQAVNTLRTAEAALRHAQDGYDRTHKVHDKGVISDQQMVEIESQLAQAQAMYSAARQQVDECILRAPCDGVLNGLQVEKGQTIIPGTKLCSIMNVTGFKIRFDVPETEIGAIRISESEVSGEMECAAVDSVFPIQIIEKSAKANPVTHTYEVIAHIDGGKDVLMAGMVGTVKVNNRLAQQEDMIIPAKCVLLKPEGPTVWVVEQGKAVRRSISIDGYHAEGVRVLSGLNIGDSLITDGYQKLYQGAQVTE